MATMRAPKSTFTGCATVTLLALTVSMPLWPAAAEATSAPGPTGPGALELVVDSSGSMAGPDPSGGTKIDAARRALAGVLGVLPEASLVGVRTYGGQYADRERGCTDTRLVVPVGPLARSTATAALASLRPVGYTPLASSLRAAVADLPTDRPRTVVLVSDGEETCGGDPCAVARELAGQGVGLTVDTVGYGVDTRTRDQLRCVAAAAGGDYTEAPDGQALTVGLARVADQGLRRYEPTGTPITGSKEPLGAPLIAPGQYVDALDPAERAYYALDLADGVTPYFAATLVHPPGEVAGSSYDSPTIALYGADGTKCGSKTQGTSQSNGGTASTVVAVPGAAGSDWTGSFSSSDGGCGTAGHYTLSVERDASGKGQAALPLELRVLVEPPPVDRTALPPAPVGVPAALPAPVLRAPLTPVTGGGSFGTAAELRPGSSTDSIRPGETVYYRVPVGWGQRLAFTAQIPPPQPGEVALPNAPLTALVAGPAREELTLLDGEKTSDYFSGRYDDDGANLSGSTAPVLFRNRDVDEDALTPLSLAGDHYLVVQLGTSREHGDVALPLRLAVEVTGEQAGAPQYAKAAGAVDPAQTSAGPQAGASRGSSDGGIPWRTVGYAGGGVAALALAGALLLLPVLRPRATRGGSPRRPVAPR